ncbi:MAG: FHA domain-containing protein [Opitutaceae bacterium]|nr:FHA domain-containing protein [Verrucomicrobiales bacterium]
MNESAEIPVWLESANQGFIPLQGENTIGRAIDNSIILPDNQASRHHALIHCRNGDQYSLIDLGGVNGTAVNGQRITEPCRLYHGDHVSIGDTVLTFRQPGAGGRPKESSTESSALSSESRTTPHLSTAECWLLVGDIKGSTGLARAAGVQNWAMICGSWLFGCKRIVERSGGIMADYMGDGFLAYWVDGTGTMQQLITALSHFRNAQEKSNPPFRVILHLGQVSISGQPSRGEETLAGPDVHFTFRAEKLAGSLSETRVLSQAARDRLNDCLPSELIGNHPIAGFPGEHSLYRF